MHRNMEDLECMHSFKEKTEISCMIYLQKLDILVTGNDDGSVKLWHPDSGSSTRVRGHSNTVCSMDVAYLEEVTYLFTTGFDGHIGVWNLPERHAEKPVLEDLFVALTGPDCEILALKYRLPIADAHKNQGGFSFSYNEDDIALPTDDGIIVTGGNDCNVYI